MPNIEDLQFTIGRLELNDGDILVVKYPISNTTRSQITYMSNFFKEFVPNIKVLMVPNDLELVVISQEEADKLVPRKPPKRIIPADLP